MKDPILHPEFREFLCLLTSHGARFMIVGAHALAALGRARVTNDIDILVEPTAANAKRLASALAAFGFAEHAKQAERHFSVPDHMATLGREPVRIDILSSISGVSFREAWKGRLVAKVEGLELSFLGLAAMKRTKIAAGRPKDLLDLALLAEIEAAAHGAAKKTQARLPARKAAKPRAAKAPAATRKKPRVR